MKRGGFDFLVVGSSTVDVIARTNDVERIDIVGKQVEKLVCISFASKSELAGIEFSPGGSAANSAVAMKKLGASVRLLSAVGRDSFGEMVADSMKKCGVSTADLRVFGNAHTGIGIVLLSGGGEKSILVFRGANSALGPSDISEADIRDSGCVFMASLVSDSNYRLFERILLISRKHHKPVIFAPSITMLHGWMPRIRKLRPSFGMVIVNYEEGCYYTGKTSIMEILRALPGMVNVVMKDVDGAYAAVKGKEAYHVNALPVKVRDATGAGDAFSGAFAYSYYSGRTVQEALKVAAAAAAVKLSHEGAHFPMGSEKFDAFFRKHRHLLAVRRV